MMGPILLAGAEGQVGREISRRLTATDVALPRRHLDVTNRAQVQDAIATFRPRVVINASAYTAVDRAEDEPDTAFAVNRDGPANLAAACEAAATPLLHLSTDYVFDGSKETGWLEADPVGPLNVYGQSKLEGERRVAERCSRHLILRTAWVFSPFGGNFVKTMCRLGREHSELDVVGDQTGSPTAASDIAATLLTLASNASSASDAWGLYHYAGAPSVSWYGFAQAIFDHLGDRLPSPPTLHSIPSSAYPTRASRPRNSILDCSKLRAIFGIDQPDWRVSLAETINILGIESAI